jgi:hypothetical protein
VWVCRAIVPVVGALVCVVYICKCKEWTYKGLEQRNATRAPENPVRELSEPSGPTGATPSNEPSRQRPATPHRTTREATTTNLTFCTFEDIAKVMPAGSEELRRYVQNVYGPTASGSSYHNLPSWSWSEVDVIYEQFLPQSLSACRWPRSRQVRVTKGIVLKAHILSNVLRKYAFDSCGKGVHVNAGGPRGTPRLLPGIWAEVSHQFQFKFPLEDHGFWMYKSRGSGNWLWTGPRLVFSDTRDLASYLKGFGAGIGGVAKVELLSIMTKNYSVNTLEFEYHADGADRDISGCFPYHHELVLLRTKNIRCPPGPDFRGGWEHQTECICDATSLRHHLLKCQ